MRLIKIERRDGLARVVRCGECRYWDTVGYGVKFCSEGYGWCDHLERDTCADWFCADGVRRDG